MAWGLSGLVAKRSMQELVEAQLRDKILGGFSTGNRARRKCQELLL